MSQFSRKPSGVDDEMPPVRSKRAIWMSTMRAQRKEAAFRHKGGRCYDCGITDIRVIEWDHVTGKHNKTGDPANLPLSRYWNEIILHCEPVCANCHRLRTLHRHTLTYREECRGRTVRRSSRVSSSGAR